jgi:hypothetical protein
MIWTCNTLITQENRGEWLNKRKKMWSKIMSTTHSITRFGWWWGKVCLISQKPWLGIWSMSIGAQYGTLKMSPEVSPNGPYKLIFFTFEFNCLLFFNLTHKIETRRANRWGAINSKSPEAITMIGQSPSSCSAGAQHCNAIYQTLQIMLLCSAKTSFLSQTRT